MQKKQQIHYPYSRAATAARKVLSDPRASARAKEVAASALTQLETGRDGKGKVASAAAKTLSDPKASKAAKTAAASALTQRPPVKVNKGIAFRIRLATSRRQEEK